MAFVRECRVYLITVLDGDSGSIPERLPDHIRLLQFFQAFQDGLVTEAEGPLHPESGVFHEDEPEPFTLQPHPHAVVGLGNQASFHEDLARQEVIVSVHEETPEELRVKRCLLDELPVSAKASGYGLVGGLLHN